MDLSQFEIVEDPDPNIFEIVEPPAPRSWGDSASDLGKSLFKSVMGIGNMITSAPDVLMGAMVPGYSSVLAAQNAAGQQSPSQALTQYAEEGRKEIVGDPEFRDAGLGERIVIQALGSSPYATLGGGLLAALLSGAGGEVAKEAGLPEAVGQVAGGFIPGGLNTGFQAVRRVTKAMPAEQQAATTLAQMGKRDIEALTTVSDDPFYKHQTLAEATQNPQLALLEQQTTKSYPPANAALVENQNARRALQKEQVSALAKAPSLTRSEAGANLRQLMDEPANKLLEDAEKLFGQIDRAAEIPIQDLRRNATSLAQKTYEAGGMPRSIKGLVQELNATVETTSGQAVKPSWRPFSYMHALRQRAQQAWVEAKRVGDKQAAAVANQIWRGVDSEIEAAARHGTLSPDDAAAFRQAKALYSQYANTFESGSIGYARRKVGDAFQMPESSVPNTVWDGTAERTRALLNAVPDSAEAKDQVRGIIRDKLIRDTTNNDLEFSPAKFRAFLRKNREGLVAKTKDGRALFDEEHLKILDQVGDDLAFLDPQSARSTRSLAYRASAGQPTTAQALISSAGAYLLQLARSIPGANLVLGSVDVVRASNRAAVNEILTQALFDKEFAKQLVSKLDSSALMPLSERIAQRAIIQVLAASPAAGGFVQENALLSSSSRVPQEGALARELAPSQPQERRAAIVPLAEERSPTKLQRRSSAQASILPEGSANKIQYPYKSFENSNQDAQSASVSSKGLLLSPVEESLGKTGRRYQEGQEQEGRSLKFGKIENRERFPHPGFIPGTGASQTPYKPSDVKAFVSQQPPLIQAVIRTESTMNPRAVSKAGARGLMQLMPENVRKFRVSDPFDPVQNVRAGTELLQMEIDRWKDLRFALAAYNAGGPKVEKAKARAIKLRLSPTWENIRKFLPKETQDYVPKVLNELRKVKTV